MKKQFFVLLVCFSALNAFAQSHFDGRDGRDNRDNRDNRDHRDHESFYSRYNYPRVGDQVWTSNGSEGEVLGIYRDGSVSVRINYSNYNYSIENIATRNCISRETCTGSTVWTTNGSEGRLNGTFINGDVSVKINYSNYKYSIDNVAIEGCVADFCSRDRVVTRNGSEGVINGVFFDRRRVSVKINYSNYTYDIDNLANTRPDDGGGDPGSINIGDTVWTTNGSEGIVLAFFNDGSVSVKINYSNYKYERSQLAVRGCYRHLCSGDRVVTRNGSTGVVNGVFFDGFVSVKINYSNYRYHADQLAITR